MAKKVGLISINLMAGTAEYNTQMDAAKAKIVGLGNAVGDAQHKLVSGNQAASGFIRVAENGMANNLRAVENFMTRTLGLGPLMQTIFPVVGAIAFAGLVVSLGEKVYSFFKKAEEGAQRVTNAFREMVGPMRLTNDELRLSTDRMLQEIAKLEGKRQNNLAITLDEARVAADKLSDSLGENLKKLNEMLQKEKVHWYSSIFTGQDTTTDLAAQMKQFAEDEGDIVEKGQARIDATKGSKDPNAAIQAANQLSAEVIHNRNLTITDLTRQLKFETDLRDARKAEARRTDMEGAYNAEDNSTKIAQLRAALGVARAGTEFTSTTMEHTFVEKQLGTAQAADGNARMVRPFENKMSTLNSEIQQAQEKLDAAGLTDGAKRLAEANGLAARSIDEVNKAYKALHEGRATKEQEAEIKKAELILVDTKEEADWQTKMIASAAAIKERIGLERMLSDAIGKGYQATADAQAEFEVAKAVGFERYNEGVGTQEEIAMQDDIRRAAQEEIAAKHKVAKDEAIDKISDHIALEQKLASVQMLGAQAVREATLALEIQKILQDESVSVANRLVKAKLDEYAAERSNVNAGKLAEINLEIAATSRLTAARVQGAEAARRAELELKYEAMLRTDSTPAGVANVNAQRQADQLKHQQSITDQVLKTVNADRDRLAEIEEEAKAAVLLKGTGADELAITIKLRDLENERLTIQARELLTMGSARDGVKAFFLEMQKSAESSAQIVYDALNSAFDKLSHNLAMLATRGKTQFAAMFKDIGREITESTIKQQLHTGIGQIARRFPGLGGLGLPKPKGDGWARKGQTEETGIYVIVSGLAGGPPVLRRDSSAGAGTSPLSGLGPIFGGSQGGGVFNLAGDSGGGSAFGNLFSSSISPFGGMMAGGGDVSADQAYIVGDDGPEILKGTSGHVFNNADARMMAGGGDSHFYTIDARGTDPVMTEMRVRAAILASHGSAVQTAVRADAERAKRVPA